MESLFRVSEIEIVYSPKIKASQRVMVSSSSEAYEILRSTWNNNKINLLEEFKILLLNRSNRLLGISKISRGGMAGTIADSKLIFGIALKAAAHSIILAHNHPSGNLKASEPDRRLTSKLVQAGKILDIPVLDHIIVTDEDYYSFADRCELL